MQDVMQALRTPLLPQGDKETAHGDKEVKNRAIRQQAVAEVSGSILACLIVLVLNVTAAAVIFHQGSPLEDSLADGVCMCLVSWRGSNARSMPC